MMTDSENELDGDISVPATHHGNGNGNGGEGGNNVPVKVNPPILSLADVPASFTFGDDYSLPTEVIYASGSGSTICTIDDGREFVSTKDIPVGSWTITCVAKDGVSGDETVVKKDISVELQTGEDEIIDRWIKLNLYYPIKSINRQWMTKNASVVRNGDGTTDWQDYTGPIYVRIEETDQIYTKYEFEGKVYVVAPNGKLLVLIEPEDFEVYDGEETKVTIHYEETAEDKLYRINGGAWQNYTGEFSVPNNTLIEARVGKTNEIYDTKGNLISSKKKVETDTAYIGTRVDAEEDAKISLNKVPEQVELGKEYSVPSYFTYGTHGEGSYKCVEQNGVELATTKFLGAGEHTISCELTAGDGTQARALKKINVFVPSTDVAPVIELNGIPERVVRGEDIGIPSGYTYGTHGDGTYECKIAGNIVNNTKDLANGQHTILCDIEAGDGTRASASKDIEVYDGNGPYIAIDVPGRIEAGEFYKIPSYLNYGKPNNGFYGCTNQDGDRVYNTVALNLGIHEISCTITNGNGLTANATKTIEVVAPYVDTTPEGPIINSSASGRAASTDITITTLEPAQDIYYSYDKINWVKYTDKFTINSNRTIYAYYNRASDGKKSKISYRKINNISEGPIVDISADPDTLVVDQVKEAKVTITARYYTGDIEYKLGSNGMWTKYTGPFTVTASTVVYARAYDTNGKMGADELEIRTVTPPVPKKNLSITNGGLNPICPTDGSIIGYTDVTIVYDANAEVKEYSYDNNTWLNYTGPIRVTDNLTIYSRAFSADGYGKGTPIRVNCLTTGISAPIIKVAPEKAASSHKITIEADKDANLVEYKIDYADGTTVGWEPYVSPFDVEQNGVIYARNTNILGQTASSQLNMDLHKPDPIYQLLDKGMYYLLTINYPSFSVPGKREYKWMQDGQWKVYDEKGILLIKPQYINQIQQSVDGYIVENKHGDTVTIALDHTYLLLVDAEEAYENLFVRWDIFMPDTPKFIYDPEPTKELMVAIDWDGTSVKDLYKIVHKDGTETDWMEYTGPIHMTEAGSMIVAKSMNEAEMWSEEGVFKATMIDDEAPSIEAIGDFATGKQKFKVQLFGEDNLKLQRVGIAKGEYGLDEIELYVDYYPNNYMYEISENGKYTLYAEDSVGNTTVKVIEVNNIDLNAPDIFVTTSNVQPSGASRGLTVDITIDYGDATDDSREYSFDGVNYQKYTGTFTVSVGDLYDNVDPTKTYSLIYVRAEDTAGNRENLVEKIYQLDYDYPAEPVITATSGYPLIKSDGVSLNDYVAVVYEARNDIENYISLDNGQTWTLYTGVERLMSNKVLAKSVKKESGLTTSVSKDVAQPANTMNYSAYDKDDNTYDTLAANQTTTFMIDKSAWNSALKIYLTNATTTRNIVTIFDKDDNVIKEIPFTKQTTMFGIPRNSAKLTLRAGGQALDIKEINILSSELNIKGDSILQILGKNKLEEEYYVFSVEDESYPVHMYNFDGDQVWDSNKVFGDASDVGDSINFAQNMVIVKVNGDLTINSGVKVEPYSTQYGGPKGFLVYVTGKLTNNGTIDNSHGAYAEGQNVYLWKNTDGTYEYVPAVGAAGTARAYTSGINGTNGTGRQTGGGASGRGYNWDTGGAGSAGTSYSGGSGGGGGYYAKAGDGLPNGGAGGTGVAGDQGGGAGNPGNKNGANGTGGLLVIFADEYENKGNIAAIGYKGGYWAGASGGGSINIFANKLASVDKLGINTDTFYNSIKGNTDINGGVANSAGVGGKGTVNIGSIRNGQYYDLRKAIEQDKEKFENSVTLEGESIFKILEENELETGYSLFKVNGEKYPVHLYTYSGNQIWDENKVFGDANDVGASTNFAQNMVIVKVDGDLTINSGVTVSPYYTNYGGPKGFMVYVTGKLTNNGTIDNSHGAYAEGQNVYLWKNADGTYEYVPAVGAAGTGRTGDRRPANGASGTGRQTGGGGSGNAYYTTAGAGAAGTSYSGGSGGGGGNYAEGIDASPNGGAGGNAGKNGQGGTNGGTGNPGGQPGGTNGTGGLLIIYAHNYENNGTMQAKGTDAAYYGGASGGGSINIFTNQPTEINQIGIISEVLYNSIKGNTNYNGGQPTTSGGGGNGTVSIGEIRDGQYYDLKKIIEQDKENFANEVAKTGDSILKILEDNELETGYHIFNVNGEKYPIHLYNYDGDQIWDENKVFGDKNDISQDVAATNVSAAYRSFSQNMVVVKVNGDLTINSGVTVSPYYTNYGTGKLINNGTIDNSHGAYAEGQNVYLWKNLDGAYEYVPAAGAAGTVRTGDRRPANGANGTSRQTGGGGSGNAYYTTAGAGAAGTSYSGGSGGGGGDYAQGFDASPNGGAGGNPGNNGQGNTSGGTGNPGGQPRGTSGTGGLLIIYANDYENNGMVQAKGTDAAYYGGASGGGSINVFFNNSYKPGNYDISGGKPTTSGGGGNGTYTEYDTKTFTVEFNANGGSVGETTRLVSYGKKIGDLPIPTGNNTELGFLGWYLEPGFINEITSNSIVRNNLILYAKYGVESDYTYAPNEQSVSISKSGKYKIELWGAGKSGYGAYTSGNINLEEGDNLYLYLGSLNSAFNGGGNCGGNSCEDGSGATDIRLVSGAWNNATSLGSRIMVAGGGGGFNPWSSGYKGGNAGGLIGYNGNGDQSPNPGNQIAGGSASANDYSGSFGRGGRGEKWGGGGGAGWYGGAGGRNSGTGNGGAGGSSYISGHTGSVAVTSKTDNTPKNGCVTGTTDNECSISPYGYVFTNTVMIDGSGYEWTNIKGSQKQMPKPDGEYYPLGQGHTGNGYARITYLGQN